MLRAFQHRHTLQFLRQQLCPSFSYLYVWLNIFASLQIDGSAISTTSKIDKFAESDKHDSLSQPIYYLPQKIYKKEPGNSNCSFLAVRKIVCNAYTLKLLLKHYNSGTMFNKLLSIQANLSRSIQRQCKRDDDASLKSCA